MFIRIFLYANFFEKAEFGHLSRELLISNIYVMFGCFGFYQILQRNLPILYAKNLKAKAIVDVFQCIYLNVILAILIVFLITTLYIFSNYDFHLPISGILNGAAQQGFLIATLKRRSEGAVVPFATDNLIRALAVVICGLAVAKVTGSSRLVVLSEAAVSMVFTTTILAGMVGGAANRLRRITALACGRIHIAMWRTAIFMMVTSVASFLIVTLDRVVAAYALSIENFADYALFSQILVAAQYFQYVIGASLITAIARENQLSGRRAAFRLTKRVSGAIVALALLLGVPAVYAVQYLTTLFFPQYVQGLYIVPMLLVVGTIRASDFWSSFLLTTGHEARLLMNNVIVICAAAILFPILFWYREFAPLSLGDVAGFALFLGAASYILAVRSAIGCLDSSDDDRK